MIPINNNHSCNNGNHTKIQLDEYFFKKILGVDFENNEVNTQSDTTEQIEKELEF